MNNMEKYVFCNYYRLIKSSIEPSSTSLIEEEKFSNIFILKRLVLSDGFGEFIFTIFMRVGKYKKNLASRALKIKKILEKFFPFSNFREFSLFITYHIWRKIQDTMFSTSNMKYRRLEKAD